MKNSTLWQWLFFGIALLTTYPTTAQWKKQNLPTTQRDIVYPIPVGKNVMWTYTTAYLPDTLIKPIEFIRTADSGQTYKSGVLFDESLVSNDYGVDIIPQPDGVTAYLILAHFTEPKYFLRKTTNGGQTWQDFAFRPETFPDILYFFDNQNAFYVADPDSAGLVIQHTTDGGNTWTRVNNATMPRTLPNELAIIGLYNIVGNNIYMPTYNALTFDWRIWHSTDRGKTWAVAPDWFEQAKIYWSSMAFADSQHGIMTPFVFDPIDYMHYTTDGGLTWQKGGKLPGVHTVPIANLPGTQTFMSLFVDTMRNTLFSAITNDLGKTWNSFKDVAPYTPDAIYGIPINFANLNIIDNHTAWSRFSRLEMFRYDSDKPLVPEQPDLDLELKADNEGLPLYGYVKYTLSVTNRGISPATDIKINWLPPYKRTPNSIAPYAYVSAYSDKGRYDSWNGIWTLDKLDAGATATASFHLFILDNSKDVTHNAQVIACNEKDLDSAPNNMSGIVKEDDEASYTAKGIRTQREIATTRQTLEFAVSPNPANNIMNIAVNQEKNADWIIRILNTLGQTVFDQNGSNNKNLSVSVENFQNGLYMIEYQTQGKKEVKKILVQH